MFGYVTAYQEKLSEEDQRIYQGYYCGLCEVLGKKYGHKSQLVLTYDLVFLAVLYTALYEAEESERNVTCIWKASRVPKIYASSLEYAADMNVLLAYQNFQDKVYDSGEKRAKAAVRVLKKDYERIAEKYPRQRQALEKYMTALHTAEEMREENPDYAANLTGEMLAEVFLMNEDEFSENLRNMFYYLGKFIYLSDAYEDLLDDIETKAYNPYVGLISDTDREERIKGHLESVMGACAMYFERLPIFLHRDILRNIIYAGVWLSFGKTWHNRRSEKEHS